jgi:hypothetical protein
MMKISLRVGPLVVGRVSKPLMLALIVILPMPKIASAATFTVNDLSDVAGAAPLNDGICATAYNNGVPNGVCTLRAAIMEANRLSGRDRIILPRGLYKLTIPDTPTVDNIGATGDLDIVQSLNIVGAGSGCYYHRWQSLSRQ